MEDQNLTDIRDRIVYLETEFNRRLSNAAFACRLAAAAASGDGPELQKLTGYLVDDTGKARIGQVLSALYWLLQGPVGMFRAEGAEICVDYGEYPSGLHRALERVDGVLMRAEDGPAACCADCTRDYITAFAMVAASLFKNLYGSGWDAALRWRQLADALQPGSVPRESPAPGPVPEQRGQVLM
jgi:hypothetical protein